MSLYLCVFDGDREIEGVEVGSYADFNAFRAATAELGADAGEAGTPPYPILLGHSDCDGEWSPEECSALRGELLDIAGRLQGRPELRFVDIDGEPLVDRLLSLVETSLRRRLPILFQ
jgi:hypothetical protein